MPYVGHSNFEKGCRKKMCTRQSQKGGLHCSLLLLLSISAREHMSVTSCAILSNFFVEQWRSKPSTIPFRIVARFPKQPYNCKYLAQFLSLNIFAARSVRYVCFEPNESLSIPLRHHNEIFRASLGKGESDWNETNIWHSSPGRLPGVSLSLRAQSNQPTFFDTTRSNSDRNSDFSYAPSSWQR